MPDSIFRSCKSWVFHVRLYVFLIQYNHAIN